MSTTPPDALDERLHNLRARWDDYREHGCFEQFVEFAVAVSSLSEQFNRLRLPGMMRLCQGLENVVMGHLAEAEGTAISAQDLGALERQLDTLFAAVNSSRTPVPERRTQAPARNPTQDTQWVKPRIVWIVADGISAEPAAGLARQLAFFGFTARTSSWREASEGEGSPLAIILMPSRELGTQGMLPMIEALRSRCRASQIFYLGVENHIEAIVELMRAGVDFAIPQSEPISSVINRVLDLTQAENQDRYRVLIVEDSRVAAAMARRTLSEHGIDSQCIHDPGEMLDALAAYRPDLVLMDMHMPRFSGIEATRVLRQSATYQTLPVVYLSGESDVGMQIEALRLGGDQFLTKPFNPVLLAAVVKTKIERFREMQRSTTLDGLTGLLNHTASKARLKSLIAQSIKEGTPLSVAMIDIDHFKAVNDTYGHPVGDQVIRGLAWLLKGRLRTSDLIGRYGGEEFLIALPGANAETAVSIIDRIRRDFAELPHTHSEGTLYATLSAGVSTRLDEESAAQLTEEADASLLRAKQLGRNQVHLSLDSPERVL